MTVQGGKEEERGPGAIVRAGLTALRDRFKGVDPNVKKQITFLDSSSTGTTEEVTVEENIHFLSSPAQVKVVYESGSRTGLTALFDLHFPTEDELATADRLGNLGIVGIGFRESFLLNAIQLVEKSQGHVGERTGYLVGKVAESGVTVITGIILGAIPPQGRKRLSSDDLNSMLGLVREWYPEEPEYTIVGTLNDVMLHVGTQKSDNTVDLTQKDIDYVSNERPMPHIFYQSGRRDRQLLTILELAYGNQSIMLQDKVLCIRLDTGELPKVEIDKHTPKHTAVDTIQLR